MRFSKFRSVSVMGENAGLPVLIYALIDPRDETVRYIGQTEKPAERIRLHRIARTAVNSGVRQWVIELHDAQLQPQMRGIVRCARYDAEDEERYWIKFYRRLGWLYNVNDGGKAPEGGCTRCGEKLACAKCEARAKAARKERERQEAIEARRDARLAGKLNFSAADVLGRLR